VRKDCIIAGSNDCELPLVCAGAVLRANTGGLLRGFITVDTGFGCTRVYGGIMMEWRVATATAELITENGLYSKSASDNVVATRGEGIIEDDCLNVNGGVTSCGKLADEVGGDMNAFVGRDCGVV